MGGGEEISNKGQGARSKVRKYWPGSVNYSCCLGCLHEGNRGLDYCVKCERGTRSHFIACFPNPLLQRVSCSPPPNIGQSRASRNHPQPTRDSPAAREPRSGMTRTPSSTAVQVAKGKGIPSSPAPQLLHCAMHPVWGVEEREAHRNRPMNHFLLSQVPPP